MGESIARLVSLFDGRVPDAEVQERLGVISADAGRWAEAHRYRNTVRDRLLATEDRLLRGQYGFSESCLESLYNETDPRDPFDSVSPFWVVPNAIWLAQQGDIPVEAILEAIRGDV